MSIVLAIFETRIQLLSVITTGAMLLVIVELMRRQRLLERFALSWLATASILVVLSVRGDLLERISEAVGVKTPSNMLFLTAFGLITLVLLYFSVIISKQTTEIKTLTQEIALLKNEQRASE